METSYRYKPVPYFALVFALSWIPWLFSIQLSQQDPKPPLAQVLNFTGLVGPLVATLIFIYGSGSVALRKDFQRRLYDFSLVNWPYILLTLVLVPAVTFLSIWISTFSGESTEQYKMIEGAMAWLPIILLAPLLEELAWRGYGVDSLRSRHGMLTTTLLFGALWALWHAPMFFVKGTYHAELLDLGTLYVVNFFVSVVAVTFLANWLYYKHRRFIVAGIFFHFIINTVAIIYGATAVTKCIVTVVYLVVIGVVVLWDRAMFSEGPKTYVAGTE